MGQKTILTPVHRQFLELVNKKPYLTKNYYWTGGTVLSEFYLHHRQSEDIDLFIEDKEVFLPPITVFIKQFAKTAGATDITHKTFLGLESFTLKIKKLAFKVDFNYYPFPRIEKGRKWKNISIDSLLDIAVNKIHTVYMKPRARDFVDLYCINQKEQFKLEYLILQAKAKFDWHIDPIQLGRRFASVVSYKDYPRMLIPLNTQKLEDFFLRLAKSLEKDIFVE